MEALNFLDIKSLKLNLTPQPQGGYAVLRVDSGGIRLMKNDALGNWLGHMLIYPRIQGVPVTPWFQGCEYFLLLNFFLKHQLNLTVIQHLTYAESKEEDRFLSIV